MPKLTWPNESARTSQISFNWHHSPSNQILDLHGDPINAGICLMSDGNHYMALTRALQLYVQQRPEVHEVFYLTYPPGVLKKILAAQSLRCGNLCIPVRPSIFISPKPVIDDLANKHQFTNTQAFAQAQGCALLINRNQSKNVTSIKDLQEKNLRLFISNPKTEAVSHQSYRTELLNVAQQQNMDIDRLIKAIDTEETGIVYGQKIHHREAPLSLINNQSDAAILYFHLAHYYEKTFPEQFKLVELTDDQAEIRKQQILNKDDALVVARLADDNQHAQSLYEFMLSDSVKQIYKECGLITG